MLILTTTDVHGATGQLSKLYSYLNNIEEPYLLLDAGDMISGSKACWLTKGEVMVYAYNYLKYDAVAIGNHEFDYGMDAFLDLVKKANFPFLSCNIFEKDTSKRPPWAIPYTIISRGRKTFGIIGATTQETPNLTSCYELNNYDFKLIELCVNNIASLIRGKVDYIVLLVHKGIPTKGLSLKLRKLAKNLTGVVDVIIGGHTHGTFSEIINGIPVIQSGAFGQELGRINLTEDGFKILNPIKLNALTKSDVFFSSCMYSFIPTFGNKVVTRARKVFPLNQDEIGALDYVLADSCYLGVKKHVRDLDGVILNKGSIRASIGVGDVTEYDLFDCMPFADNRLLVTEIPGYELLRLIEEDVRGDLIPANMNWSGDMVINGKRLQEMRAYRIVMSDYLVKMLKVTYVRELELKQLDAIVSGAGTFLYLPYSVESRVKKRG